MNNNDDSKKDPVRKKLYAVQTNSIYQPFDDPLGYNDAVRSTYKFCGSIPGEEPLTKQEDDLEDDLEVKKNVEVTPIKKLIP